VRVLAPHTYGAALDEILENIPVRRFRYFVPSWQAVTNQGGMAEDPWRGLNCFFRCCIVDVVVSSPEQVPHPSVNVPRY
jgi:hypothetical protein